MNRHVLHMHDGTAMLFDDAGNFVAVAPQAAPAERYKWKFHKKPRWRMKAITTPQIIHETIFPPTPTGENRHD